MQKLLFSGLLGSETPEATPKFYPLHLNTAVPRKRNLNCLDLYPYYVIRLLLTSLTYWDSSVTNSYD